MISYQEITNNHFDSNHNVLSQTVLAYTDSSKSVLLSCQEIRSSNFTPSGVAGNQIIVTYADATEKSIVDVKVITNQGISPSGNVKTTVITTYSNATVSGDTITPTGDPTDRKTITTTSFDKFGNALTQSIVTESYASGSFIFGSCQTIANNVYDIHNHLTHSEIKNYSDTAGTFVSLNVINYSNFDVFGNACNQVLNSYTSQTAILANLIDSKVIVNTYADPKAAARGNPSSTTVSRYTTDVTANQNNSTLIDQTVTNTSSFDAKGNALTQTQDKYIVESSNIMGPVVGPVLIKIQELSITDSNYDALGNAKNQKISTYSIDGTNVTLVNYQEITNNHFDSNHNVLSQTVLAYTDSSKSVLLSCQEIRYPALQPQAWHRARP